MKHISVTYSPYLRKWQTMVDGNQDRRVIYTGTERQCVKRAVEQGEEVNQPVFLFDRDGRISHRIG